MSIVKNIHDYYEAHPRRKKPPTGWPTGSRLGTCCAQLQLLRTPELATPEPIRGRALRVFENGDRIEAWLGERLKAVFPGLVGFQQEPFFFSVPMTSSEKSDLMFEISERRIWGRVMERFNEPKLYLGDDGRVKARTVPRDHNGKPINYGFVLDLDRSLLWVPTYIDFAVKHPELGLCVVECKSMSNFAFRRAVIGNLDFGKRCQLVGFARATGANVVLVAYRSETAHLCEIAYTRGTERTRVVLTKQNGSQEVFFVDPVNEREPLIPEAGGEAQGFPADVLWEMAETWTPYDTSLEAQIDERVKRVLLFDGDPKNLKRENGPNFVCPVCDGTGIQTRRKGSQEPLKTPKPCVDCEGGMVSETELPSFPCGYSIAPDTLVLLADHSWRAAEKLEIGDRVVGVDEVPAGRFHRIHVGTVARVMRRPSATLRLVTAEGSVVCSPEHPWLVRCNNTLRKNVWLKAADIRPGHYLARITTPTSVDIESEEYMGGYVRGLVDGEGSVQERATGAPTVRVAMSDVEALERLCWYLQYFGLHAGLEPFSAYANRPMWQVRFGGRRQDKTGIVAQLLAWPINGRTAAVGYLGAMFDGEGSLETPKGRANLRIHQILGGSVADTVRQAARLSGLPLEAEKWERRRRVGAFRLRSPNLTGAIAEFFCATRPSVLRKATLENRPVRNVWTKVVSVEPVAEMAETIELTVDGTRTFIAAGYASHNCPVTAGCFKAAAPEFYVDDRPHWKIARANWEKSGLTYKKPEGWS